MTKNTTFETRSQRIISLLEEFCSRSFDFPLLLREEEYPVDQDPYSMDPNSYGGARAGRTRPVRDDHMPRKGVGGISSGNPLAQERKWNQNTFPWNGEPINRSVQARVYNDPPSGGVASGVGGFA